MTRRPATASSRRPGLFVTGAPRSGTSLADKLLSAHPQVRVLSQPLQLLHVGAKRRFLESRGVARGMLELPLGDLFGPNHTDPMAFTSFLHEALFDTTWVLSQLQAARGYSGHYFVPDQPPEALVPDRPVGFSAFMAHYLQCALDPSEDKITGSKETFAEEFIPYLIDQGTRVLLVLRDPRDVVASAMSGAGAKHAGAGRPPLFYIRQWRKSVAFALEFADHANLMRLRYEDLVLDPDATLGAVAHWLGLNAFPAADTAAPITDFRGTPWPSNSSHAPTPALSGNSIGAHRRALPDAVVALVEELCAPEMATLGYARSTNAARPASDGVGPADIRSGMEKYLWKETAINEEAARRTALHEGRFEPALHLFPRAFARLKGTSSDTEKTVHERRASVILHNLARTCAPGVFLVPANLCAEAALALAAAGHMVELVDISPETLAMDPKAMVRALSRLGDRARGILWVRSYGAIFDTEATIERARAIRPELLVIDDRCACRPDPDAHPGTGFDAVVFSTGYGKYLDLGWGGFARLARGQSYRRHSEGFDTRHAAAVRRFIRRFEKNGRPRQTEDVSSALLARWPLWLDCRRPAPNLDGYLGRVATALPAADRQKARMNSIYEAAIPATAQLGSDFNAWRFQLRVPDKPALLAKIFAAGLFASGHYRPLSALFGQGSTPNADALAREVVNLFNDHHVDAAAANAVARIVARHVESATIEK